MYDSFVISNNQSDQHRTDQAAGRAVTQSGAFILTDFPQQVHIQYLLIAQTICRIRYLQHINDPVTSVDILNQILPAGTFQKGAWHFQLRKKRLPLVDTVSELIMRHTKRVA